ncbi:MAG: chitobiase/beta-hexosaminidase C-terminal domain-containing protein, partial [Bacteroidales bacterium]|nr:chitobiase/beta-hexosaminidase C-terminal domain-containing protein [Bacteroidales bacterium]
YWSFGSNEPISKTEGTLYDGKPIILKFSGNLKAIAYYEGVESKPVSVRYTVGLSAPEFDLTPGAVPAGARVTITSESKEANPDKNYHIAYTVDGSEPSKDNGTEYTSPIEITEDVTIKAITWTMGVSGIEKSEVASASYTIETTGGDEPIVPDTVAVPTFSVPAGEVEKGTKVAIACATEGAKIYYTVDGSEPTAQSTEYKEAIVINEALTLKAIAVKEEMADSKVATAVYTVKDVANEELELAGVSVYPNPSNGVFNLELPVSATVEVFASNGVLRQRVEAGAGVVTLNIER